MPSTNYFSHLLIISFCWIQFSSCHSGPKEKNDGTPLSLNQTDSSLKQKEDTVDKTNDIVFIRQSYYQRNQNKNVNSWYALPDTTNAFSASLSWSGINRISFIIYSRNGSVVQRGKLYDTEHDSTFEIKTMFIDMNFDGLLDFNVNFEMSATGNSWDEYWLFSPTDNRFHYNSELSALISAKAYPIEKRIESYYRSGMDYQILADYEWINKKLVLVKEEIVNTDSIPPHQVFERQGGVLNRIKADNEVETNIRG